MEHLESTTSDIQAAIESGKCQVQKFEHDENMCVVVPAGMKLETLEPFRAAPRLLINRLTVLTPTALLAYWAKFSTAASVMFVDVQKGRFVGVLDYHAAPDTPAYGNHTVTYECPKTPEWSKWLSASGRQMDQVQFAYFIEENAPEIVDPDSAQMLEIATTLQSKNNASFSSAIKLENGQTQFSYVEKMDEKAGVNGQLTVPSIIKLAIKPLHGEAAYAMQARFRYRIQKEGGLTMWYDLIRPERIFEDAVNDVLERITTGMENGTLIEGYAP